MCLKMTTIQGLLRPAAPPGEKLLWLHPGHKPPSAARQCVQHQTHAAGAAGLGAAGQPRHSTGTAAAAAAQTVWVQDNQWENKQLAPVVQFAVGRCCMSE